MEHITEISLKQKEEIFWKIYNHSCYLVATEEEYSLEESSIDLMETLGYSISEDDRLHLVKYADEYFDLLDLEELK